MMVPLTADEQRALDELAVKMDLPPWRVMIQALRQYQLVASGRYRLVEVNPVSVTVSDWSAPYADPDH